MARTSVLTLSPGVQHRHDRAADSGPKYDPVRTGGPTTVVTENVPSWRLPLSKWARWVLFIPYVLGLALLTPFKPPWIVCFLAFPVLFAVTRIWSSYRRIPQRQRLLYIGTVVACAIGGVLLVVITGVGTATICVGSDIPQPPGVRLDLPCHAQLDGAWVAVGLVIGVAAGLNMVAVITGIGRLRPPFLKMPGPEGS